MSDTSFCSGTLDRCHVREIVLPLDFLFVLLIGTRVLQTHLTFGRDFTLAVEMKQVAQQEAERARFLVEKVLAL